MADDKTKTGKADRSRVAGGERYEVSFFTRKHGITTQQARQFIARIGNDRAQLDAAAERLE
jgi:hypothetical protein